MSPILVRPVREQLEHDRVIRLLELRLKRKNEVATNIGADQTVPVKIGQVQIYPDLVLTSADKTHKLIGTVEVETAESVNHLEAMAQWAHLGRARAPFHLYVPASSVEIARRLATENHVNVSELWSFHTIGDQTRFTLVQKAAQPEPRRTLNNEKPAARATAAKGVSRAKPQRSASPTPARSKALAPKKARPAAKSPAKNAAKAPKKGTGTAKRK